jgi:hypothetical protein
MGLGDRLLTKLWLARALSATPRRLALTAALASLATAGCGKSSSDSRAELPPLPPYWQGSIHGPRPEAWGVGWQSPPGSPAPVAAYDAAPASGVEPYAIPTLPALTPPATTTSASPVPAAAPHPALEALPANAALPSPGVLLPPEPIAEAADAAHNYQPAPTDVVVVGALPALSPPAPEAFAQFERPLHFPAEPAPRTSTAAARAETADHSAPQTGGAAAPRTAPTAAAAGQPTGAVVNERATAKIRRGNELAERGAYFAARNQFVDALRLIAEAKDRLHGSPRRTVALAAGLRAIDEAEDFSPNAAGIAGDLKLSVIVASHQTPAAKGLALDDVLPQQLADMYLEYAGRQLGAAVAGEPSGSMALHALGKVHSRLGRLEPAAHPQADRLAFALQQAALLARSDNHLAAHELGVLLAECGHYAESDAMLLQVAQRAPHPVVFRNLARVERQLGRPDLAAASERQAEYLATRGVGGEGNVVWVPVDALVRTPDPLAPAAPPAMARGPAPMVR